jgi:hypothetical protein
MRQKIAKYLKVLRVELQDLEEDLAIMADLYGQRERRDEITGYVFLENVSVLKGEIAGIESIIRSMDDLPVERFGNLGDFVEHIGELFRERSRAAGYPDGVYALVKRKLDKVRQYIESTAD